MHPPFIQKSNCAAVRQHNNTFFSPIPRCKNQLFFAKSTFAHFFSCYWNISKSKLKMDLSIVLFLLNVANLERRNLTKFGLQNVDLSLFSFFKHTNFTKISQKRHQDENLNLQKSHFCFS